MTIVLLGMGPCCAGWGCRRLFSPLAAMTFIEHVTMVEAVTLKHAAGEWNRGRSPPNGATQVRGHYCKDIVLNLSRSCCDLKGQSFTPVHLCHTTPHQCCLTLFTFYLLWDKVFVAYRILFLLWKDSTERGAM